MLVFEPPLGRTLQRWRAINRVKQSHAAELFGVDQSTVSRWERGVQKITGKQRAQAEIMFAARLTSAADSALARLVQQQMGGAHLMCDHSHRLLALSPMRRKEFGSHADELIGQSLWPYITEDLAAVEHSLESCGWFELQSPPDIIANTTSNSSDVVPIRAGQCRLSRFILSDGTAARLIETIN